MGPLTMAAMVFFSIAGALLLGQILRVVLPDHHQSTEAKDTIKLVVALIVTLSALVLGLMVSSAKSSFESKKAELRNVSADIVVLDRMLLEYGPETENARAALRRGLESRIGRLTEGGDYHGQAGRLVFSEDLREVQHEIVMLEPKTSGQSLLQAQAVRMGNELARSRWLLNTETGEPSIPLAFLVVLVFWLVTIFTIFSMFAPRNGTVIACVLCSGLAISGAVFLILALDNPYAGPIRISARPLSDALEQIDRHSRPTPAQ